MAWSMTKPKRKKKSKQLCPSEEFKNIKGPKRERLILERKKRGLTQKQLGDLIGCSAQTISRLESGRMNPNVDLSMQLEKILKTNFFELFPD
ncbi:helix-turn-helix transcriptional regulator [Rummeliibacillus sp. POC4]|uniref:helix-turn-helix transcriptional regulator n=1 Tax=Rummeliibacillus sp. POC4 TaxID=2305899 RepID=UPI000E671545|nr:helix-turn-helix transcriptional regulator [Rummeliibacillus sp. POC4]RIJ65501.1 XRE family transcriptional regulator [Rummeliibacillus sp. POC4]